MNRSFTFRERFQYWFDNRMTKGFLSLIRLLIVVSLLLALIISLLIIFFRFSEENGLAAVFWNNLATLLNSEVPYFEDGAPGYVLLTAITALAGVLFTSVLIGIFTSAIEEKLLELKSGNSRVLERGHTVILGFYPGEYTLIRQLVLAAAGKPDCVVIAEDMDRTEMEGYIKDNVEAPKNFRIVCRSADIMDPSSLEKCSLETCKTVIVAPTEDTRTIKAVLAVSTLLQKKGNPEVAVNAIIAREEYRFPPSLAETHRITALQTNETLAKMIAHTCTQMGLSETFREVFNFEGSEMYLVELPKAVGLRFDEVMTRLDCAVPIGIFREDKVFLNPAPDQCVQSGDRLLVFSEEEDSAVLRESYIPLKELSAEEALEETAPEEDEGTVILGYNSSLHVILRELPENVKRVYLAGIPKTRVRDRLQRTVASRGLEIEYLEDEEGFRSEEGLLSLARLGKHIVVLNDHGKDEEAADLETIFLILHLRDIRTRYGLRFNITAEMRTEHNQNLVASEDHTDFVVASSMSSLFLAQLAESPELIDVFRELLSNEGNELFLKEAERFHLDGAYSVRELRRLMLRHGYIFLGYVNEEKESLFNPPLEEKIELRAGDALIVLGCE